MSAKPRPTEAEFAELRRQRDEKLKSELARIGERLGATFGALTFHACGSHDCYCACPDGPCQHDWNGPVVQDDGHDTCSWHSASCSRCGTLAMNHDMRCMP